MSFEKLLTNIKYATQKQKDEELWDIEGMLSKYSNQILKFDLRPLVNNTKKGSSKTKADKMVFDINNEYIIVDVKELHQYIKNKKTNKVYLNNLIKELDWNIILNK